MLRTQRKKRSAISKTTLHAVSRTQGNSRALKQGDVTLPDFELDFEEVPVLVHAFRRMVRELAYDVCEMALTTYICAKAHGVKFTALPIFLVRDFHHDAILHHVPSGLYSPADLAGKTVGVNRGYTVTTGVWARSIIQDEFDVDLSSITWAPSGDEHVEAYRAPANVQPLEDGDLEGRLSSGDLVAAVGAKVDHPDVAPMFDDPFAAALSALKTRGLYPINHLVVVRDDLLAIIMNNTRTPHFVKGDLQAHVGCPKAAQQEMERAAEKYGTATLKAAMLQLQEYTERIVRNSISDMPDGEYEAEECADTDGHATSPIPIRVKIIIKGSNITVDFTGTPPVVKGAINSPYANTASATLYSLQFFLAPHAPQNQGMFNPITISLPDDCWLNAKWPAPTIGCTTLTSSKITSAIWQALAKACPEKITGSTNAECNWFVSSVVAPDGSTNVFSDLPAGGWGGTPFSDGMNVTEDPLGNCMNMPAESAELLFPIAYEAFELRTDSGGPGQHRGGLGAIFKVRYLSDGELSMESARTLEGSPGVNGGERSDVQRQTKIRPNGELEVIGGLDPQGNWKSPLLESVPFSYGETFMFESTGGGGWGDALARDPASVVEDVLDEYISVEAARQRYGVVFERGTMQVDDAATAALRDEMRAKA